MMKKNIIVALIVVVFAFVMVGCGNNTIGDNTIHQRVQQEKQEKLYDEITQDCIDILNGHLK